MAAARSRGLRAANGAEMLIQQAAIAFERWTGVGGMADVMRAAVAPLLADGEACDALAGLRRGVPCAMAPRPAARLRGRGANYRVPGEPLGPAPRARR